MAAQIPGARFEVIEDVQHLVNLERPDRFNQLLLDLLATLTPRPGAGR